MSYSHDLLEKFKDKNATIGIIGLGYVGLPLAIRFAQVYSHVIGFDIDQSKIHALEKGKSYIKQIPDERVKQALDNGFLATTDFAQARSCDAIIICVPTPLTAHQEPDLSFVRITIETLQPHLRAGQIISLESTTFPGTTEELLVPRVEQQGFEIGEDFFVVYSPEREDPGNKQYSTHSIPKVIGGITNDCLSVGTSLYQQAIETMVPVSSTKAAEMTKLLENIHRAVNIGLVNEMKMVADKMGINIHEVIDAAATKPFGFTKYSPGPGLGGHCIPIDPFYLTWKAKEYGLNTRFIELAGEINRGMPEWVVGKLADALNDQGKAIKGSKILILGIAYKKDIDDPRESPAIKIMEILRDKGAEISYCDPHIPVFPKMRDHYFDLKSVDPKNLYLSTYDIATLLTDHDQLIENLKDCCMPILDTRNVLRGENVIPA
jgi:UDP-N-acetyl-D-glucosamine dehydrogenase